MQDVGSNVPLWMQNPELAKALDSQINQSYESFRENEIHHPEYKHQTKPDRPSVSSMSVIRRYPDGKLDLRWAANMILNAIHDISFADILPVQKALLTVIFPFKYRAMEPMQAEIVTQFSDSEKESVREIVLAQLLEEENWNAGRGGGSVNGRSTTRAGG